MSDKKILSAQFFQQESGNEPVRDWLLGLPADERKLIGDDIKAAELGWPVGMPLVRSMGAGCSRCGQTCQMGRSQGCFSALIKVNGAAARLHQENTEDAEG